MIASEYFCKIKVACKNCNTEINIKKSKLKTTKYCSRKCSDDFRRGKTLLPNTKIRSNCLICKKEIYTKKSHYAKGEGKYCSKICRIKGVSKLFVGENNPNFKGVEAGAAYKRRAGLPKWYKKDLFEIQKGKCRWCRKKIIGTPELDHVIPLTRGGTHELNNLVLSCKSCNIRRSNKLPSEYFGILF